VVAKVSRLKSGWTKGEGLMVGSKMLAFRAEGQSKKHTILRAAFEGSGLGSAERPELQYNFWEHGGKEKVNGGPTSRGSSTMESALDT